MSRHLVRFLAPALLTPLFLITIAPAADTADSKSASPDVPSAGTARGGDDFARRLDNTLMRIEQLNQDIWNELDEEYALIIAERDGNAANIATQIEKAKDAHAKAFADIERQQAELEKRRQSPDASPGDANDVEEQKKIDQNTAAANLAFDFSLANLQQLYQLNSRRFDDLMKIHGQRDILEDRRMLEEKNLAALEISLRNDAANPNLSPAQREMYTYFQNALANAQQEAEARYRADSAALDEYRDLVVKRLGFLKKNLSQQTEVMARLSQPGLTTPERDRYLKDIARIAFNKDVEEKIYQNDVRFLEEKIAYERDRTHELASLATQRHDLDATFADLKTQAWLEMSEIQKRLDGPGLTSEDRANLKSRLESLDNTVEEHEKDYRDAVRNLTARRDIVKKGLQERLAYIRERNQLRQEMYAEPVTSTSHQKFRNRIVDLQNRHIAEETANRKQLAELAQVVPPTFAFSPWKRGDMDIRLYRLQGRMDAVRTLLKRNLDRDVDELNNKAREVNLRMSGIDLADQQRKPLETQLAGLNKQIIDRNNDYRQTLKRVGEAETAAEEKIMDRGQYIEQRSELMKDLALSGIAGPEAEKEIRKLQSLDSEWRKREGQYRLGGQPFSGIFMVENFEMALPDDVDANNPVQAPTGAAEPAVQIPVKLSGAFVPVPPKAGAVATRVVANSGAPVLGEELGLAKPR